MPGKRIKRGRTPARGKKGGRSAGRKKPKPAPGRAAKLSDVLLEVNRRWLSTLDLEKILPEVGEVIQRLLKADDVSLLLVDPNGKELVEHVIVSHRRAPDNRYRIRIKAEGITGWVAAHRKPLVVGDVRKDKRYVLTSPKIRSEAAVPVLAGDRLLGVLNVESTKVGHFGKKDVDLLQLLASQIAIALLNSELHDRERVRGRQLLALHHLARVGDGAIPHAAFLQRVVDAVRREFSCYYAAAFLGDYEREVVVLLASSCAEEIDFAPGATQAFEIGVIGTAFKIGETVNVRDVNQDPNYVPAVAGIQSEMCVPVRVGDRCLGLLDAQSQRTDAFTADDVVFLETVARLLAATMIALEKSPPQIAT